MTTINTTKVYRDYSINEYKDFAICKIGHHYAICSVAIRKSDDEVLISRVFQYFSSWETALTELNYQMEQKGHKPASAKDAVETALEVLGLTALVSAEQVKAAFRAKVKAAHTAGHFTGDMDALVNAKEQALKMVLA